MTQHRNPDLDVDDTRLAGWNRPESRRASFRNLHTIHRRGLTFRAAHVLPLVQDLLPAIGNLPGLQSLTQSRSFCGLAVVQDDRLLYETYAADFGPRTPHSMQSITKTLVHLMVGRLVESGRLDLSRPVAHYLPGAGEAYASAAVQDVLDMNIGNNFSEDYAAPYAPAPPAGAPVGYAREEIAMGWRLPPEGEGEFGVREFAARLVRAPDEGNPGATQYKSANTDVLGWVVEAVSGLPLARHVSAIVEAAGIEDAFHISMDCEMVPVLSGGGVMTMHDLLRYGLILARSGLGIDGAPAGSARFLRDTMSGNGTLYRGQPAPLRYRNHLMSNGRWVGHPGYAGQFLMACPEKRAALALFSVLETPYGDQPGYFDHVIEVFEGILARI